MVFISQPARARAIPVVGALVLCASCAIGDDDEAPLGASHGRLAAAPFAFTARTALTNFGNGTNHFPADFTREPGFFMNATGADLVIQRVNIALDSTPYAVGGADVDICVEIRPPVGAAHGTRTGIEQFCIAQHKSAATTAWPEPSISLAIPGQGLLLEPDHHVVCTAQGIVDGPVGARTHLSDFACTLELAYADLGDPRPPVQSIRTPYFDERFSAEVSSFTPHVNPTMTDRPVVGMMSYVAVASARVVTCIDSKTANGAWDFHCFDVDRSRSDYADVSITPLSFRFGPDDRVAAHCQIANPTGSFANICANYLFVEVPRTGERFVPLAINDSIPSGCAHEFCHHAYADRYALTDPAIEGNRDRCTLVLGGALP